MSELIEKIKGYAIERDGCWVWIGATQQNTTTPIMMFRGKVSGVRRFLAEARGNKIPRTKVATYTCNEPLCVHPNHVGVKERRVVLQRTFREMDEGKRVTINHSRAMGKRKHSKLTMELAREIRESSGSLRELAKKYEVTTYCIWAIKKGKTWKEPESANPFAALIRRSQK